MDLPSDVDLAWLFYGLLLLAFGLFGAPLLGVTGLLMASVQAKLESIVFGLWSIIGGGACLVVLDGGSGLENAGLLGLPGVGLGVLSVQGRRFWASRRSPKREFLRSAVLAPGVAAFLVGAWAWGQLVFPGPCRNLSGPVEDWQVVTTLCFVSLVFTLAWRLAWCPTGGSGRAAGDQAPGEAARSERRMHAHTPGRATRNMQESVVAVAGETSATGGFGR